MDNQYESRYSRKRGIKFLAQDRLERRHKYTVTQISAIFPTILDIPKAIRQIMGSGVATLGNNQNSV